MSTSFCNCYITCPACCHAADKARSFITSTTDGPVTDFVMISRAMRFLSPASNELDRRAAHVGVDLSKIAANVLHEELIRRGYLKTEGVEPEMSREEFSSLSYLRASFER